MKSVARYSALLILLLSVAAASSAAPVITDLSQPVSIAGQWRFQVGDDPAWSTPSFDDSGWQTTIVPASAPEGHAGYGGVLWYRLQLQLDLSRASLSEQRGALALVMGDVMSAYEIFAGGIRLGGIGGMPPSPQASYDRRATWSIPAAAVSEDGKLVVALRVWRDPGVSPKWETGPYDGDFLLGNVGKLRELMLRKALLPSVLLAAVYLVMGLYHLLIARRNPVLTEFFWFGLLSLALAIYTVETSQARFLLDVPYLWHKKIEYLVLYISPFLLGKTLLGATRTPGNLVTRGFHGVFILYFLAALLLPGDVIFHRTLTSFQYLGAVWAVSMASIMGWRAYKGSRSARGVVALMLILAAAVVNDVILKTPLIGSGNVLYLVYALMLLFIALLMAERYTEILKQLETSVEERTAQLSDANRELEAALETKGQFLATMSHEMRTPMNAVLGLTRLGLKTDLDEQQRDYFGKVEQSAEDLQDIIESVLDFSRMEEGELTCVREPFSVEAMLGGLQRTWQEAAEQKGLEFSAEIDPGLPDSLMGDGKRLKQVLGNLLSNAVKFTERGKVVLAITAEHARDDAVNIKFSVSDTGVGISDSQRERLFEAFSQADGTMTRQYGGTGLGLSIAQRLVELMGGHIDLDSTSGEGSRFHFSLQLPVSHTTPEMEEVPDEIDLSPIRGAHVLLVDDSDLNLQVAGELLRQAKLNVDLARDGSEAVDMVSSGSYDCVLMDVQMPVMDGYQATETIRASAQFAELPIIAMTANAMPQDRARGAEAGMNDYVPKPIDPDLLHATLLKWITPGDRHYEEESVDGGSDPDLELPAELPGIAVSDGLVRVGGNVKLYLQLLSDLSGDYEDAPLRIKAMLQSDDLEQARQLAHKLRGIANNLGAGHIGASAEAIEASLKEGKAVTDDMLGNLEAALATVIKSQATLAPFAQADTDGAGLSDDERLSMMEELRQAIADNNPEALELVEKLLPGADDEQQQVLTAAKDALDIYDFAGASDHLNRL